MISRSGTRTSGASSGVTKILRDDGSGPVVTAGFSSAVFTVLFMVYPPVNSIYRSRHCEPTGRRKAPPDDRLREAIHSSANGEMDCFVACASRNDGCGGLATPSRRLHVQSEPRAHPCIGIGVLGDVADHGDRVGAGGEDLLGLFELDAADGHSPADAEALLPL